MQGSGKCFVFSASVRSERPLSIPSSGSSFVNVNNRNADPKDGFPKAGLAAQLAGGLTKAKKPTAKNSLGLDIR